MKILKDTTFEKLVEHKTTLSFLLKDIKAELAKQEKKGLCVFEIGEIGSGDICYYLNNVKKTIYFNGDIEKFSNFWINDELVSSLDFISLIYKNKKNVRTSKN